MNDDQATSASSNDAQNATRVRTVRFRIQRTEGPDSASHWDEFDVPVDSASGSANIISCLQWIAAHPVTVAGQECTPVAFDSGCLEEVCGACSMVINGRVRQACSCLMNEVAPHDGDVVTLQPMSKFPIVRDLFVDRQRLFEGLKRVKAWVPIDGTYDQGAGPKETPAQQQSRYVLSECMSCGCCLEACPQYLLEKDEQKWNESFAGAAVISQVRYFNEHPTGMVLTSERLDEMSKPGGVSDCGNAQNCVRVCPKHIPLTESIGKVGRAVTVHRIKQFFSGR